MVKQRKSDMKLFEEMYNAITEGNIKEIQNLVEYKNCPITNLEFELAVKSSQLEILSYFLEKNHSPSAWPYAVQQAAIEGKINFLDYICKHIVQNLNDYSDQNICSFLIYYGLGPALENNQLEAAKFLYNTIYE